MSDKDIVEIAGQMDDEYDAAPAPTGIADYDMGGPEDIAPDMDPDMGYASPDEVGMDEQQVISIDKDLLLELVKLVKEKGYECATDPECGSMQEEEPEGEFEAPEGESEDDGESEAPEGESDEKDESDDDGESEDDDKGESEDEEVEEGTSKDKDTVNEEDEAEEDDDEKGEEDFGGEEGDEEGDSEEADVSDIPDADDIPGTEEGDLGISDVEADEIEDAAEGELDHTDCEQLVDRIAELGMEGTLTIEDLPEIAGFCFPEKAKEGIADIGAEEGPEGIEGPEGMGGIEAEEGPEGMEGPDMGEPEVPEDEAPEAEEEGNPFESTIKPVNEINEGKPWEKDEDEKDEKDEKKSKKSKKPAKDEEEEADCGDADKGLGLAESVAKFASDRDITIVTRPCKTPNGIEFLSDDESFVKLCEAMNSEFDAIKEGKGKGVVGAMSKYARCYPVSGSGRMYYVFK